MRWKCGLVRCSFQVGCTLIISNNPKAEEWPSHYPLYNELHKVAEVGQFVSLRIFSKDAKLPRKLNLRNYLLIYTLLWGLHLRTSVAWDQSMRNKNLYTVSCKPLCNESDNYLAATWTSNTQRKHEKSALCGGMKQVKKIILTLVLNCAPRCEGATEFQNYEMTYQMNFEWRVVSMPLVCVWVAMHPLNFHVGFPTSSLFVLVSQ